MSTEKYSFEKKDGRYIFDSSEAAEDVHEVAQAQEFQKRNMGTGGYTVGQHWYSLESKIIEIVANNPDRQKAEETLEKSIEALEGRNVEEAKHWLE